MKKIVTRALAVAAAVTMMSGTAYAGDAAVGEKYAGKRCKQCHTWDKGGKKKIGPNLFGVMDRPAGTSEGFKYSKLFVKAADKIGTWEDAELAQYLKDTTKFLRKTSGGKGRSKMTFKVKKGKDQENLIAWLKTIK